MPEWEEWKAREHEACARAVGGSAPNQATTWMWADPVHFLTCIIYQHLQGVGIHSTAEYECFFVFYLAWDKYTFN